VVLHFEENVFKKDIKTWKTAGLLNNVLIIPFLLHRKRTVVPVTKINRFVFVRKWFAVCRENNTEKCK